MQYRKPEYPSNIMCKFFLTKTCRRSSNQGALCWFRHDQLPLSAPNVAIALPGVATLVSTLWEKKFPLTSRHESEPYVRTTTTKGDNDATSATAIITPRSDENDDDPDDEHDYVNTEIDINIESQRSHSYDIDKQCSIQLSITTNIGTKPIQNNMRK